MNLFIHHAEFSNLKDIYNRRKNGMHVVPHIGLSFPTKSTNKEKKWMHKYSKVIFFQSYNAVKNSKATFQVLTMAEMSEMKNISRYFS